MAERQPGRGTASAVTEHVEHVTVRVADEEASHPQGLVREGVHDLRTGCYGSLVGSIDVVDMNRRGQRVRSRRGS